MGSCRRQVGRRLGPKVIFCSKKSSSCSRMSHIHMGFVPQEVGSASDFDDGYGSDLMGDDDDRARLAEMTELDREMELAERSERRDEIKERRQTARVLRQQQRTAAKVIVFFRTENCRFLVYTCIPPPFVQTQVAALHSRQNASNTGVPLVSLLFDFVPPPTTLQPLP